MNKVTLFGIGGVILGLAAGFLIAKYPLSIKPESPALHANQQQTTAPAMMNSSMEMTMSSMSGKLEGKTGNEFDQAFIEQMIQHHQGAIDMANLALKNGSHPEIKQMAQNIISAQTTEITQMKQWQKAWFNQ